MSAKQPGAGPPLRTPAFTISVLGKKIQLFFEKPWITWLNQIQLDLGNQDDLALLADRGSSVGGAPDQSLEVAPLPASRFSDSEALLITDRQAQIEDIADRVLALIPTRDDAARLIAELLQLLTPPAQRNWVDYVMRESGGAVKLEGETAAFPALRRSTTTPADTQSVLADKSALTGHEVLDEVYGAGWNGKVEVPTKNAVYDKVNALEARIPSAIPVPVAEGGTGSFNAAGARTNLGAAAAQTPGAHTIPLAKITGGGADGSITWNAEGVVTGFADPT
jgi:hypothetical protein